MVDIRDTSEVMPEGCLSTKVRLDRWLKSIDRVQAKYKEYKHFNSYHHAYGNCLLRAISTSINSSHVDPLSILKQICAHAREKSKLYSVFLRGGETEFLSMIQKFERYGVYQSIPNHLKVSIKLIENALQRNIVAVDEETQCVVLGDKDKPITPETIVVIKRNSELTFFGTQLLRLDKWLESIDRVQVKYEECQPLNGSHRAYKNSLLRAISVSINPYHINPMSIQKRICAHARELSEFYSVFLKEGETEFLSMIQRFEQSGVLMNVPNRISASIQLIENALQKRIVVADEETHNIVIGETDKPITPETIVIIKRKNEQVFIGTHTNRLDRWLKSIDRVQAKYEECQPFNGSHQAYRNSLLRAISVSINLFHVDPLSIQKRICAHAREMSKFYSVFLKGETEFLSMIQRFEQSGVLLNVPNRISAFIQLIENALQKRIVVADEETQNIVVGETDKPIKPETIVIIKRKNEQVFIGTHTSEFTGQLNFF
ncbi:uncharacterized protein [Watersipora subatra]|uniref:uncharacterized protein n=1 Tax=Watersipora subatra TaxID=2589382 RepID=UPI00355B0754